MRNSGLTRGLTQPWTHHDIIRLVAPFTEHGRQLDLEASSRTERRLVFRPRLHGVAVGGMSITEHLVLENPSRGTYRAVRDAILPDGLLSRLIAQGPEPGGVLAAIEHVPVARGIHSGKGFVVAISHVIEPFGWTPSHGAGEPTLVFKRAVAKAAGLSLTVVVSDVRGYPATAEIAAPAGETIDLPHDFLSVAGAEWRPLERVKAGWRTTLSVRGREPRLSERVEASVERAAAHVAQTIVEPPQRFHAQYMWARWMAELRRAGPLLFWIAVCLAAMRLSSVPQSPLAAALMVDVSGSIDKRPIGQFSRQIEAISRRQEAGLVLIIGDDRVRRTEVFEAGRVKLAGIAFEGGGDTDFTPLLEAADRHRPDIGVVLTDLGGPARFRPRWPVIWAVPAACAASVPPFGTRLVLA